MLRNRILILLGGCFLAASAACADDVGYVDCSSHSDETQVFAKARKSPEVVGSLQCGERFTVLVYGFVFSRIQTSDGKIGYVFSNLISTDRSATSVQKTGAARMVASAEKVSVPSANGGQPQSASVQPSMTQASVRTAAPSERNGAVIDASAPPAAQSQPAQQQTVAAQTTATRQVAASPEASTQAVPTQSSAAAVPDTAAGTPQTASSAPAQPAPAQSANVQAPAVQASGAQAATPQSAGLPDASVVTSNLSAGAGSAPAPAPQPDPPAAAQPQPAPAQPAAAQPAPARSVEPAVRPAEDTRWEKPLPSVRQAPLIELFGGYAFTRLDNGAGAYTNMNGALGSFGWNWKPWVQLTGDSSYNFVTTGGYKYVMYGNHYGARFFRRVHNRWAATPFAEALVGGSRMDTTYTGTTYSQNCISYKVGGGIDLHPSRRWEIRLVDFDYYRTAFGTNLHQNNYWVSTGVVLRLFGGRGYE